MKCFEGWEMWLPKMMRVPNQRGYIQEKLRAAEKKVCWEVGMGNGKSIHD